MALASNALFTIAEVKAFFPSWTDSDAMLELFINAVSAEIESFTNDKFKQRAETLILDGPDSLILDLGSRAVSVSQIREGDNGLASIGTIRDTVKAPYTLRKEYGHVFSLYKWKFGVQNIEVQAAVGWVTVPEDLKIVALRMIKKVHDSQFSAAFSLPIQSESIGSYSYSLATMGLVMSDIVGSDHATLLRYRRWVLA